MAMSFAQAYDRREDLPSWWRLHWRRAGCHKREASRRFGWEKEVQLNPQNSSKFISWQLTISSDLRKFLLADPFESATIFLWDSPQEDGFAKNTKPRPALSYLEAEQAVEILRLNFQNLNLEGRDFGSSLGEAWEASVSDLWSIICFLHLLHKVSMPDAQPTTGAYLSQPANNMLGMETLQAVGISNKTCHTTLLVDGLMITGVNEYLSLSLSLSPSIYIYILYILYSRYTHT